MTFQFTPPASVCVDPRSAAATCHRGCSSDDIYFALTGWHPADAAIDDDGEFDVHVFASMIAVAAAQGTAVHAHLGLSIGDFRAMLDRFFSGACDVFCACDTEHPYGEDDEVAMVRSLLLAHRSIENEENGWLASNRPTRGRTKPFVGRPGPAQSRGTIAAARSPLRSACSAEHPQHALEAVFLSHAVRDRRNGDVHDAGLHGLHGFRALLRRRERREPSCPHASRRRHGPCILTRLAEVRQVCRVRIATCLRSAPPVDNSATHSSVSPGCGAAGEAGIHTRRQELSIPDSGASLGFRDEPDRP
jgi:hypothetical protein